MWSQYLERPRIAKEFKIALQKGKKNMSKYTLSISLYYFKFYSGTNVLQFLTFIISVIHKKLLPILVDSE